MGRDLNRDLRNVYYSTLTILSPKEIYMGNSSHHTRAVIGSQRLDGVSCCGQIN